MISAINVIATLNLNYVDFLLATDNMVQYEEVLKGLGYKCFIIEDLYVRSQSESRLARRIQLVSNIITLKKVIKTHLFLFGRYSYLFVPSADIICRIMYYYLKKTGVVLCVFDDGIGTYDNSLYNKKTLLGELFYAILLDNNYRNKFDSVFCYKPELMPQNDLGYKIVPIAMSTEAYDLLTSIAGENYKVYSNKAIVVLDQGVLSERAIIEFFNLVLKVLNKDSIIIKLHPRIKYNNKFGDLITVNDGLPFEAVFPMLSEDAIIVSYSSTGCISPFLFFNSNKKVVFLIGIYEPNSTVFSILKKLKQTLNNDNIFLPTSMQELNDIICEILM